MSGHQPGSSGVARSLLVCEFWISEARPGSVPVGSCEQSLTKFVGPAGNEQHRVPEVDPPDDPAFVEPPAMPRLCRKCHLSSVAYFDVT